MPGWSNQFLCEGINVIVSMLSMHEKPWPHFKIRYGSSNKKTFNNVRCCGCGCDDRIQSQEQKCVAA